MDAVDDLLASSNDALARGYDHVPYRPKAIAFLGVPELRTVGLMYGCGQRAADVLDLGCGAGAQLALAADQTTGRLVGVDLSSAACAEARRVLVQHGERVESHNADLLALEPEHLGAFDIIYCLGVISFVPPSVRQRLVELIGACLRPGGVAVVSYYTGALFAVRASIARTLWAGVDIAAGPGDQVRQARATLERIRATLPADNADARMPVAAAAHLAGLDDTMFFHEALNAESIALETSWLERALRAEGVGFVARSTSQTSRERALAMDARSLLSPSYAYTMFAKGEGALGPAHPGSPQLLWSTALKRRQAAGYDQPAVYAAEGMSVSFTVEHSTTQALLDVIGREPTSWEDALAEAQGRAAALSPATAASEAQVAEALLIIWSNQGAIAAPRPAKPATAQAALNGEYSSASQSISP